MLVVTQRSKHDVIVIGAGPAGTSAAILLSKFGFDVAIIERLRFPRPHVGVCISDKTLGLFDYLGLGSDHVSAGSLRRNLTAINWGGSGIRLVQQQGFHVDRGMLDQYMLSKARANGAAVYHPARVLEKQFVKGAGWWLTVDCGDGRRVMLVILSMRLEDDRRSVGRI
jgi:flavin-dependent dehydrogenase